VDNPGIAEVRRINLLKVPLDLMKEEDMEKVVRTLAARKERQQIILLGFFDFMKCRRDPERRRMMKEAALIIPTSKALIKGVRFLRKGEAVRYMPFEFVIRLLGILENLHGTIYILGSHPRELNISSANLRDSFPGLRIVGRHTGYFPPDMEEDIVLAIKKAAPNLLLAGGGLKGNDLWILRRKGEFQTGMYLWCRECFDIFCGKAQRLSRKQWDRGLYLIPRFLKNPLRIFQLFTRLYFNLLLLIYRIRKL